MYTVLFEVHWQVQQMHAGVLLFAAHPLTPLIPQ